MPKVIFKTNTIFDAGIFAKGQEAELTPEHLEIVKDLVTVIEEPTTQATDEETPADMPKRRGRPPKNKGE